MIFQQLQVSFAFETFLALPFFGFLSSFSLLCFGWRVHFSKPQFVLMKSTLDICLNDYYDTFNRFRVNQKVDYIVIYRGRFFFLLSKIDLPTLLIHWLYRFHLLFSSETKTISKEKHLLENYNIFRLKHSNEFSCTRQKLKWFDFRLPNRILFQYFMFASFVYFSRDFSSHAILDSLPFA